MRWALGTEGDLRGLESRGDGRCYYEWRRTVVIGVTMWLHPGENARAGQFPLSHSLLRRADQRLISWLAFQGLEPPGFVLMSSRPLLGVTG